MSESTRAVWAAAILLSGIAAGWGVWGVAFPHLEPVLIERLGAAGGALALWGLIGPCLATGFVIAFYAGRRWVRPRQPQA